MSTKSSSSTNARYWAKLVSLEPESENVILTKDSYLMGHDASNDIRVTRAKLDEFKCKIYKGSEGSFWIENILADSVVVEDETLGVKGKKQLVLGDRINFLQKARGRNKEISGFVFCPTQAETSQLKRSRTDTQHRDQRIEVSKKEDHVKNAMNAEAKCAICLDYIYNCVVVMPCLHNFCASCISDWIEDSESCPQCRGEFTELRKNTSLNNIIEAYMKENPALKRPIEEYKEMDGRDVIRNGYQINNYDDGGRYKGNVVNGKREGQGWMLYMRGDIYSGEWLKDMRHGTGVQLNADGTFYEGGWKNDKKEGKGKFSYHSGSNYDGDWFNNNRHGQGRFTFKDGAYYEGEWFNNNRHGQGKEVYLDGTSFSDTWVSGYSVRKGTQAFTHKPAPKASTTGRNNQQKQKKKSGKN